MQINDTVKALLMILAGGLIGYAVTDFTDRADAGSNAQMEAIAKEVFERESITPTGKPLIQVVDENTKQLIILNTELPHIVEALKSLSDDD